MGTQEVELERAGEKSAVDGSDPVCSFIHNFIHHKLFILDHESSGRVTHDSHKLQTKAMNHATRRYMNRRELQLDQPIHVPLLRATQPSSLGLHCRHSRAARATPSNHTLGSRIRQQLLLVRIDKSDTETTCNRQNR